MVQTYKLSTVVYNVDGEPVKNAILVAELDRADYTVGGSVFPHKTSCFSDDEGNAFVELFSNLEGTQNSLYCVTVTMPNGVVKIEAVIQMPTVDAYLEQLVDIHPITPEYSTAAAISAAQAATSAGIATQKAVQTAEDRDRTHEDALKTAADRVIVEQTAESLVGSDQRINTLFWLGV